MRTLLSLALLAVALPASAQATFGIKLGINAATVSIEDEDLLIGELIDEAGPGFEFDKRSRLGFVGGLTADIPVSATFSFRPEILYTQKGYAFETTVDGAFEDDEVGDFNGTQTFKIDYVEVPLLVAYRFPTQSTLDVALEVGPTLAYKLTTGIGCSGDFGDCDDDNDDDAVEDFDLGGAVGVTIGSGPFGVGLRYTGGFLSIANDEFASDDDPSVRNQVFTVTAHYRFGAGGLR